MRDIAMSWRPSRRLSTRAMWALWPLCLRPHPGRAVAAVRHRPPRRRHQLDPRRRPARLPLARARLAVAGAQQAVRRGPGAHPRARRGRPRPHRASRWAGLAGVGASRRGGSGPGGRRPWRSTDGASATTTSPRTAPATSWPCSRRASWAVLVALPLGPAPGIWLTSAGSACFGWAALSTSYIFVGSACVMLLVQRRPRTEAIPTRLLDVYLQLLVTAASPGSRSSPSTTGR